MSDRPNSPETSRRRLNGWKEIATYFDRSVRTVQRWEAEHHLPIRRLALGRTDVVTALVADLERWRDSAEAEAAQRSIDAVEVAGENHSLAVPASASPERPSTPSPVARFMARPLMLAIGLVLVLALVAAGALWQAARSPAPGSREPSSLELLHDRLSVRNAVGRELWAHQFSGALVREFFDKNYRIVDLDGDGHQEVLAIPHAADRALARVKVHCFDSRGKVLWTHQQVAPQTFGTEVYGPPYPPSRLFVTDTPGGKKVVWTVSDHTPWFPSVLHKLDPTGAVRGEYWSNGYITDVQTAQWDGRRVVLVGARNDEHESASLALLDEDRPSGSSPAVEPRYQCRTCPAGAPLAFVVFSKPARFRQLRGTGPVESIQPDINGSVIAWVDFGDDFGADAPVFFTLDRRLRPIRVDTADTFETACLALARTGSIPAFRSGEGLEELGSVLWWGGSGFVELKAKRGPERPGK